MRKKCPYLKIFWSVFSRIRTEYEEIRITVRMREDKDQNNSKYGHFSLSALQPGWFFSNTKTSTVCKRSLTFDHEFFEEYLDARF